MGLPANCNGRKRPAEDQDYGDGYKRPCRPAEKEYDLYEALESSEHNKKMVGMDNNIESITDSDDIFVYHEGFGNPAFIGNGEQLIINGDVGNRNAESPRDEDQSSYGSGVNLTHLSGLHKGSDEVGLKSDVGVSYEDENPLEGLDLFFDDVGLDFGVHGDDINSHRESSDVGEKHGNEAYSEDVGATAEACTVKTEQAFIEENEVHDWLFSSDQADPSLGFCSGDLLEPSLAHLLEGMAGS